MAKNYDMGKTIQEMMASAPFDTSACQNAFKTQALIGEKLSKAVLGAIEKSTEISAKWTKETLGRLEEMAAFRPNPADYTKAVNDFSAGAAELAAENLAAFAEVAKKLQLETVEIALSAGKEASADVQAAVKKATEDANAVVKKATVATAAR